MGGNGLQRQRRSGGGAFKTRHRVFRLAVEAQRFPAGHHDLEMGAGAEQIRHERRGGRHMLEVVEQQEHGLVAQRLAQHVKRCQLWMLAQIQRTEDRVADHITVTNRRQRHEEHAVGEFGQQRFGRGQGQAGLAHAARPSERQQPYVGAAQPAGDRTQVCLPSDETGQNGGEIGRWCGSGCRKGDERRSYLC